jgi:nucleolar GTP-binding protein
LQSYAELHAEEKVQIEELAKASNAYLIQMSNLTKDGIEDVKSKACDILLDHRLTQKAKDPKKAEAILNRLHIAEPKKRDNISRPEIIPDSVHQGLKKTGPTIIELQEEFGGAGNFHIPVEEHYMLEKEEWRYDKFPEFYNGSNVLDFYDPEITAKLDELEREEAELLKMENLQDEVMEEPEGGCTLSELHSSLKEVRTNKALKKQQHKLKAKDRVPKKSNNLSEMTADLEAKGFDVNKESLRSRSKVRRTITDIEEGQDRVAKHALDSDDDEEVVADDKMNEKETKDRGRLKKRTKTVDSDVDMSEDERMVATQGKSTRSLTPAQRKISAQKMIRSLTKDRREGSVPKRRGDKPVPESHVRLMQKIEKKVFRTNLFTNPADRAIQVKMPKHLFSGKMDSTGKRDRR